MPTEQPEGNIRDLKDFKDIQRACCKRYSPQPGGPQGAGGYIYIQILDMFHMFSLVCCLAYGVKSSFGHDRSQCFGSVWHVSDPKLFFLIIS